MVWNKTPDKIIADIQMLLGDFTLRYQDIAELMGVSKDIVCKVNSKMSEEFKAARYSGINRSAKLKSNHMCGKTGVRHHNAVEGYTMSGPYKAVWAPDWWTGNRDSNRVLEHQLVWAAANSATKVPDGCVIHHKDENKLNNDPTNLEMMTRKDHARLHAYQNFLESATTRAKARRD